MRRTSLLFAGGFVLSLCGLATALVAQAADDAAADGLSAPATAEDSRDEDELDDIVAPVALFPDTLLSQVFVAATFPLEVVKASRAVADMGDASPEQRADVVEDEDWDPSVQVLASGFPTLIDRMADEIDWTEQLGDAVLVQTDDVLDAVQRQRARATATGYLSSNDAQTVEDDGDEITIAPADPEIIYVPSYDPAMAFSAAPYIATADTGYSTGDLLTTGAMAFGGALLLNELFEDDDDWNNYWRGPSSVDWDDGDFNSRPNVKVDGRRQHQSRSVQQFRPRPGQH